MPYQRYAVVLHKLELRVKALAANIEEFPHLSEPLARLSEMLDVLKNLMAEQARLTAQRQEVSKQIAELSQSGAEADDLPGCGGQAALRPPIGEAPGLWPAAVPQQAAGAEGRPDGKPLKRKASEDSPEAQE